MYDFIVVGAGPAGSHFAHKSAELGNKIIVFEGGKIGTPLSCSGHVSLDLWKLPRCFWRAATVRESCNQVYQTNKREGLALPSFCMRP